MSDSALRDDSHITVPAPEHVLVGGGLSKFVHELRGPLSGIIGLAGLMSRKVAQGATDPAQQTRHLEMLQSSARDLLDTLERTVELLRLEQATPYCGDDTFDCRSAVLRSVAELAGAASARNKRLQVDVPEDPVVVLGASDPARQAVTELLGNALRYSDRTDVHLTVRPCSDSGHAVIEVRDHGPGLSAEDQLTAFQPFGRGSAAQQRNEPGSGLGLPLVQRLAVRCGATLSMATSATGTRVTLAFAAAVTG